MSFKDIRFINPQTKLYEVLAVTAQIKCLQD